MNNKKKLGAAGLATAAATLLALTVPVAAFADTSVPPTKGSGATQTTDNVYLYDATLNPAAATVQWTDVVAGSSSSSDPLAGFAVPTNTTDVYVFLSDRGHEAVKADWKAYADPYTPPVAGTVLLPTLSPTTLIDAGASYPAGAPGVKTAGGSYSLGFAAFNGSTLVAKSFVYIDVTPSTGAWTYSTPAAAAVAPQITTQPASASVLPGASATFTAAASGTPTPTVQWQSSTDSGTTWNPVAGATSTTLAVSNVAPAQNGTKYRAVFTNSAGTATTNGNATLTVTKVAPDQPSGVTPGKVDIVDPAKGATSVVVPAGAANHDVTFQAWAWSDPTNLGQFQADASGNVTVPITGLPAGVHTIALTLPADANFAVVVWDTITILSQSGDPLHKDVDLLAAVTASDLWSLSARNDPVDFNDVTRGTSVTRGLGEVTVVDDRNVLKGWNLDAGWTDFTSGTNVIASSELKLAAKAFTGYTPIPGVTVNTAASTGNTAHLADSTAVSTLEDGAHFDADLTFHAPTTAQTGAYHSTLTLTLTSR